MRAMKRMIARFRSFATGRRGSERLREEMEQHLFMQTEENIRAGMSRVEALRQARLKFGAAETIREDYHAEEGLPFIENLLRDVGFALRALRRSPGFTLAAVLTLVVGIGGVTAVFSVVDAVLLRPLPFTDPGRLVRIHEGIKGMFTPSNLPAPDVMLITRENRAFSAVAGFTPAQYELNGAGSPFDARAERVTASLFPLLGVRPVLGRTFTEDEDETSKPVVVISFALWHERFHANPAVLGQIIDLNRRPYSVIGVMPRNFEFPLEAGRLSHQDLWVPMSFTPDEKQDETDNFDYGAIARLKPGMTLPQASTDVRRIIDEIQKETPPRFGIELTSSVGLLGRETGAGAKPLLQTLMAAMLLILLIGCVNLANLLMVRGVGRRREFGMRIALGAARFRLVRQLLTESIVLTAVGGAVGTIVALLLVQLVRVNMPDALPRLDALTVNLPVLGVAFLVTAATGTACGLAPALIAARAPVLNALRDGGPTAGMGRSQHRLQAMLVATEVALAMVLLTGSALLLHSFEKMLSTDPGFQPEYALTASLALPAETYPTQNAINDFYRRLLNLLSSVPGVRDVGGSSNIPIVGINSDRNFIPVGYVPRNGKTWCSASNYFVMGDYFRAMQIPVIRGRYFTPADDGPEAPLVAVVSQTAAREYWPGESPIGRQFRMGGDPNGTRPPITVVGVVGDVRQGPLDHVVYPQMYEPFLQFQRQYPPEIQQRIGSRGSMYMVLRATTDPIALAASLERVVHQLDPLLPVSQISTMDSVLASTEAPRRLNTAILASFSGIALALALLGIYGVLAYTVTERQHEIAIRIATGATRADVLLRTLRQALVLGLAGTISGLAVSVGLTRYMTALLYGVEPLDAMALAGAATLLLLCALSAGWLPARRAASIDPMQALRNE